MKAARADDHSGSHIISSSAYCLVRGKRQNSYPPASQAKAQLKLQKMNQLELSSSKSTITDLFSRDTRIMSTNTSKDIKCIDLVSPSACGCNNDVEGAHDIESEAGGYD